MIRARPFKAYSFREGMLDSGVATAICNLKVAFPTFSPLGGTYDALPSDSVGTLPPNGGAPLVNRSPPSVKPRAVLLV